MSPNSFKDYKFPGARNSEFQTASGTMGMFGKQHGAGNFKQLHQWPVTTNPIRISGFQHHVGLEEINRICSQRPNAKRLSGHDSLFLLPSCFALTGIAERSASQATIASSYFRLVLRSPESNAGLLSAARVL